MYRSSYQKGFFTLLYSVGNNPLKDWVIITNEGHAKRIYDEDIKSLVFEIMGTNVSTTYIHSPGECHQQLGIKLPFLVLLVKNLNKYFSFEVKIKDDQRFMRRFRVSNFQRKTSVSSFCTAMPMGLSPGWNQIQLNLADFTRRAYGTNYIETVSVQINANIRIRRIYFTERLYTDVELPDEYRLLATKKEVKQINKMVSAAARPPSVLSSPRVPRNTVVSTKTFLAPSNIGLTSMIETDAAIPLPLLTEDY